MGPGGFAILKLVDQNTPTEDANWRENPAGEEGFNISR